jgi:putative transcriptional regulator
MRLSSEGRVTIPIENRERAGLAPHTEVEPAPALSPGEIKAIREHEAVSQPVFARYLNVSKNLVSDWERDAKRPGGPAPRLLSVVKRSGLRAIA